MPHLSASCAGHPVFRSSAELDLQVDPSQPGRSPNLPEWFGYEQFQHFVLKSHC